MAKQTDPETARKRAWLNRYRDSLAAQKRLAEALQELRSRATSIRAPLPGARSASTGLYSDRVADSVQRIADAEQRLLAEQQRGQIIATEIINAVFAQLPLKYAQVLLCQYIDGMDITQTAQRLNLSASTVPGYRRKAFASLKLSENVL